MFARGLRAVGTVRGQPRLLDDQPWASPGIAIERARHRVREGLRKALGGHRYAPVLIALAIGDQAGVALVIDNKVLRYEFQIYQSLVIFRALRSTLKSCASSYSDRN